jgi:demethoxyubiquinone hydroxylase (CLK1/Coq7/Cat5 family)
VEAIESFVEEHFQDQIKPLEEVKGGKQDDEILTPELIKVLKHCCEDEVHHKEEAVEKLLLHEDFDYEKVWWAKPWRSVVHWGSATAAEIARRI